MKKQKQKTENLVLESWFFSWYQTTDSMKWIMTCLSIFLIIQNENLIFKLLFIYFESFRLGLTHSFVLKNINISTTDTTEAPFHPRCSREGKRLQPRYHTFCHNWRVKRNWKLALSSVPNSIELRYIICRIFSLSFIFKINNKSSSSFFCQY